MINLLLATAVSIVLCISGPNPTLDHNSDRGADAPRSAWVMLYDDSGYKDRVLTIKGGKNIRKLGAVRSDDRKKGFNDKASSARWNIPAGWMLVLYDDTDFKDRRFELRGTGRTRKASKLKNFNDKASSCRWERI